MVFSSNVPNISKCCLAAIAYTEDCDGAAVASGVVVRMKGSLANNQWFCNHSSQKRSQHISTVNNGDMSDHHSSSDDDDGVPDGKASFTDFGGRGMFELYQVCSGQHNTPITCCAVLSHVGSHVLGLCYVPEF